MQEVTVHTLMQSKSQSLAPNRSPYITEKLLRLAILCYLQREIIDGGQVNLSWESCAIEGVLVSDEDQSGERQGVCIRNRVKGSTISEW